MKLRKNLDGQFMDELLIMIDHKMQNGENDDGEITEITETLTTWLQNFGMDQCAIKKIKENELTIDDFKTLMTRDDLKTLKLPLGQELRIWSSISRFRKEK